MKNSLLCQALMIALGLTASAAAWAQHDHSQHSAATKETPQKTGLPDPHAGHAPAAQPPVDHSKMDHSKMDHASMDHAAMGHAGMEQAGPDPGAVDHSKMDHSTHATPAPASADHTGMDHAAHQVTAAPTQPREPIPAITDADRAAAFPVLKHHGMDHGSAINSFVLFNRLEGWEADPGTGQAWEAQAWVGGDINRLWLRSEGERSGGNTESANLEVMYGRSVSAWWDVLAGVRHDFAPGDSQSWAAFGVQGMAPYKFEVSATAYLGESGQTAANLEIEYELLLTNRLILQPLVELSFHGKDDPSRHVGSGLSKAEAGLRLRYEFSRRFAPYLGVVHERVFGRTADFHRAEGEGVRDTRVVAGIRFWF